MGAPEDIAELGDPTTIALCRIEKFLYEGQMVSKVVAAHEFVGGEKPNSGAAAQFSGVRPGKEFFAFAMRAGRLDRQDRRDFGRVEIVAREPQDYKGFAVGLVVNLRRRGCQAVRLARR